MCTRSRLVLSILCLLVAALPSGADSLSVSNDWNRIYDPAPPDPAIYTNLSTTNLAAKLTNFNTVALFAGGTLTDSPDTPPNQMPPEGWVHRPTTTNHAPTDGTFFLVRSVFGHAIGPISPADVYFGEPIIPDPALAADMSIAPLIHPPAKAFYVPEIQKVIATEPGFVDITWYNSAHAAIGPVRYLISSLVNPTNPLPVVALYHTHFYQPPDTNFVHATSAPRVNPGEGVVVIPHYNLAIPSYTNLTRNLAGELVAEQATGLIVLEYRVNGVFAGTEVVDVRQFGQIDASPQQIDVGSRCLPYVSVPASVAVSPLVSFGLTQPDSEHPYAYQHPDDQGPQSGFVWATRRTTAATNQVEIYWRRTGVQNVVWPYELHRYTADWGASYQLYVRAGDTTSETQVGIPASVQPTNASLIAFDETSGGARFVGNRFSTAGTGMTLLHLQQAGLDVFQVVRSVDRQDSMFNQPAVAWDVGKEITDPYQQGAYPDWSPGYIHRPAGNRYDIEIYDGVTTRPPAWNAAWTTKQIIPVNTGTLEIWWWNLNANTTPAIQWPSLVKRYVCSWPTNSLRIVIANTDGGPTFPTDTYETQHSCLYYQNDPVQAGFNPNDEHAYGLLAGSTYTLYALRDDLGTATTSEPYVLLKRQNNAPASNTWDYIVYRVLAEGVADNGTNYTFDWPEVAGTPIDKYGPIAWLDSRQHCDEERGVSGPYWRDRNKVFWAKAAGDTGNSTAQIVMHYFYATNQIPGAYFPTNKPALPGAHVAWLDYRQDTPGEPTDIRYTVQWPSKATLLAGETLIESKHELPSVQYDSVDILYQQAVARGTGQSVKLIDPILPRSVLLTNIPAGIDVITQGKLGFFPKLPPHLRSRIFHDRNDAAQPRLVFQGEYRPALSGINEPKGYLLLNVLSSRDRDALQALSGDSLWVSKVDELYAKAASVVELPPDVAPYLDKGFAVTAGQATDGGYVTLAFNNSTNLAGPDDDVTLEVFRVDCPRYMGDIEVIISPNPFDERVTMRHSGDFGGNTDRYQYEWYGAPDQGGKPPPVPTSDNDSNWDAWVPGRCATDPPDGRGALDYVVQGSSRFTLSDNWFICRYRPYPIGSADMCGTNWTIVTNANLAPGWIKRVVDKINPFEQRVTSGFLAGPDNRFFDYSKTVDTIVSMAAQAGPPPSGNIPLDAGTAADYGLLEIYETVMNRALDLTVDSYGPANDALLLIASRIADLYMLLGNEAYADASDPTIAFGTDDHTYGNEASAIFCFQNQLPSLLEEELGLLRGRDNSKLPSTQTFPYYNRLWWNFTGGAGEAAYKLNYDIRANDSTNGVISEAEAKKCYPQGHGDAWGHYLSAIKNYYRLLKSPNFAWEPRMEAVLVGGVAANVDYMDERKFAKAAASKAQTGAEIVSLTYRSYYQEDPALQWQGYVDTDTNRAWGLAEWGMRAGQGALIDWIVGNSILPPFDTNHTGIEKIDRTTVTELRDIASAFATIQQQVDKADVGVNPLGVPKDYVAFNINPYQVEPPNCNTHFEQIFDLTAKAMVNAITAFNHAQNNAQLLRRQSDSISDFQQNVVEREADFKNRLIEVFGYPYSADIGPSGTYATGYDGPDLYNFMITDDSELQVSASSAVVSFVVTNVTFDVSSNGDFATITQPVRYYFTADGLRQVKPPTWSPTASRRAPGEIQMALSDLLQAKSRFQQKLAEYQNLMAQIEDQTALLHAQWKLNAQEINILNEGRHTQETLNQAIARSRERQLDFQKKARMATLIANAMAEAFPKGAIFGLASGGDFWGFARYAVLSAGNVLSEIATRNANQESLVELDHQQAKEDAQALSNIRLTTIRQEQALLQQLAQLQQLVRSEVLLRLDIYTLQEALRQASGRYSASIAKGERMAADLLRFRQQTAAKVQDYRYKDMAFRIFRNDALQKYRAQFDLAAMYVYLAASTYDYESNFRLDDPNRPGKQFLQKIIQARTIGKMENGVPQTHSGDGDGGLADPIARLSFNWVSSLKPEFSLCSRRALIVTNTFSVRNDFFRVSNGQDCTTRQRFRDALSACIVTNLLTDEYYVRYCEPPVPAVAGPALRIVFSTTVQEGQNFFGKTQGGGEASFDSTRGMTKILSVGVRFSGYDAMALSTSPKVYLIPTGNDIFRSPTWSSGYYGPANVREWKLFNQTLPIPFPVGDAQMDNPAYIPRNDSLAGLLGYSQKYLRFVAGYDSREPDIDRQLIERSVWNSGWVLIIPESSLAGSLMTLIHGASGGCTGGISDIKILIRASSY